MRFITTSTESDCEVDAWITGKPEVYRLVRRTSINKRVWSHAFPGTHLILGLWCHADLALRLVGSDSDGVDL